LLNIVKTKNKIAKDYIGANSKQVILQNMGVMPWMCVWSLSENIKHMV